MNKKRTVASPFFVFHFAPLVPLASKPSKAGLMRKRRRNEMSALSRLRGSEEYEVSYAAQPGGHVMSRPDSTWKCRCGTLCPACSPILDTTR